ncbi:MAG TPA: cyclic nucleotide-binding domain-containing protein, partial [bacterium]|nr:cyclic nucleotide-binding domain-containing protein [bacterium]
MYGGFMPEQVDYERLKRICLFSGMNDAELDVITKRVFEKQYKKGSMLFVEGMAGEVIYVVLEGGVDVSKKTKTGEEKLLAQICPGEIVGEMSIIDSGTRTASGRTNT